MENRTHKTVHRKTVQFYDSKERLKKDICQNIMAQYIIQDDIFEYKKDTVEVNGIFIWKNQGWYQRKRSTLCATILIYKEIVVI